MQVKSYKATMVTGVNIVVNTWVIAYAVSLIAETTLLNVAGAAAIIMVSQSFYWLYYKKPPSKIAVFTLVHLLSFIGALELDRLVPHPFNYVVWCAILFLLILVSDLIKQWPRAND